MVIAPREFYRVRPADAGGKHAPGMVRIDRQQGVVQVKKGNAAGGRVGLRGRRRSRGLRRGRGSRRGFACSWAREHSSTPRAGRVQRRQAPMRPR
jgi:hypothetical protein